MLVERQTNMLVERRAPSRLCRKYCAVPPELDFVPLLLPGTDVPSFPVSPLRGWSNSAAHFFAGLGVATQTRGARHPTSIYGRVFANVTGICSTISMSNPSRAPPLLA